VSSDRSWLILEASTGTTQEAHCLDLREPILGSLVCWWPRLEGRKYSLDHHRDRGFFVLTNDEGPNNRILHVTEMEQRNGEPTVWWNYDADRAIEGLTIQEDFLAVAWRREGLPQISVCRLDGTVRHAIDFPDPSYVAEPCGLPFESKFLRYRYSSLAHPVSYYEWHSGSGETVCRKVEMPASAYDVSWVRTERVWVTSADGTLVPVSLAYRHDRVTPGSGQAPCYLYGYGSYGIATDPYFRTGWLTLLNHGLVVAIAHIRGGDDMGTAWYEQAKFEHKHRSFDDFEAAIRGLCAQGWTAPDRMVIHGGSAGGMLMGVMANRLGTGVAAVVADVPFVDVRNTMMDASLPLTPGEYDEWGNPEEPKIDAAMRAYSPYDNVREQAYPAMWVTAGLYDPRVTYWEPAKWVAALRWARTNPEIPLCLWTKMEAGHAGASSRLAYWRDMAKCYSFVLDRLSHALEQREAP
jgi:oligopeptidase B